MVVPVIGTSCREDTLNLLLVALCFISLMQELTILLSASHCHDQRHDNGDNNYDGDKNFAPMVKDELVEP